MKFFILLFALLTTNICFCQNVTDSKGKKQGEWSRIYPGTKVYEYKGQFKDGRPVGTFTYFYKSTKVKAIIKHGAETNRSEAFFYHENGAIMSHGIYRDLKKDSIWLNYGPSGRISNSETFKNGILNGKNVIYYVSEEASDNSKRVSAVNYYVNGKLNGESVQYFENGSVKEKGTYTLDKKTGIWERYHASGKKMMLERFKNGIRHGWCFAYDEAGKEIAKVYYYNGKKLEGKELEARMNYFKQNGISPNE
jgi:antitoxin component YwqK of YwqJK toxin-antitoxin module